MAGGPNAVGMASLSFTQAAGWTCHSSLKPLTPGGRYERRHLGGRLWVGGEGGWLERPGIERKNVGVGVGGTAGSGALSAEADCRCHSR